MSTKRNHRRNSAKTKSTNVSSATSHAMSEPLETSTIPLPTTPSNLPPLLGPDPNVYSGSDDFGTDYFNELFDATMLPAAVEHKDPSKAVSLPDDSLGVLNITSDSNFSGLTAQDLASLDDPCRMFPAAGGMSSQAPSNSSFGAVFPAPSKNSPLSIQSLEPSLQFIHNNSESLSQFSCLLPIINIIATTEAHLQRASIPIDEAMCTNKACMSQISRTMENEEFIKCNSCSLLIATAMQMVIMLYEKALSASDHANSGPVKDDSDLCSGTTLAGSPHSTTSSTLPNFSSSSRSQNDQQHVVSGSSARPSCSNMPSLQFGVFQFEPDEATWFRNQIIRNELQRCVQTLRACNTEQQKSKQQGATGGPPPGLLAGDKVRKSWLLEMERRAYTLIASLPVRQDCDADTDIDKYRACEPPKGSKRSIDKVSDS